MNTYKILLHQEPEGGYTVTVPVLPGCITYGVDKVRTNYIILSSNY